MKQFRYWLKGLLAWVAVPIWAGPLRGYKIGLFTGSRFVRGTYGGSEIPMFEQNTKSGDVVFDIGAHVGYFSLLMAKLVGPTGRVFAFEPLPLNLKYLRQHVYGNNIENVEIYTAAVGKSEGWLTFDLGGGTGRGRLSKTSNPNELRVKVYGIDELYNQGKLPCPDLIKMDVEGAELEALNGALEVLKKCKPRIMLSTHGDQLKQECDAFLRELDYQIEYIKPSLILAK